MTLYQIDAGYFCAGIEVDRMGIIRRAAPILQWSVGKLYNELRQWCLKKKAIAVKVV